MNMHNRRILIIEDDENMLELLHLVFQDEGYNVITANNSEVTEHVSEYYPDLLIIDVGLNGSKKDGLQVCTELKRNSDTSNLPIVLLSSLQNLPAMAQQCGADTYIAKPFEVEQLLSIVKCTIK